MAKSIKKIKGLQKWFAGLSMLGLLLFVGFFIQGRFQQAQFEYTREARRTLLFAQKSISDSIQVKETEEDLEQALDILKQFKVQIDEGKSTIRISGTTLEGIAEMVVDSLSLDTQISVQIGGGEFQHQPGGGFNRLQGDSNVEVKQRFVQRFTTKTLKPKAPERDPLVIVDTNLVLKALQRNLFVRYPFLSIRWELVDTAKVKGFNPHAYVLKGDESREIIPVFDGINRTALAKIKTDILFSFLLVLLVGFAFYQLFKSARKQERLLSFKNQLISNISHELKTPVSSVKIAIESLRRRHVDSADERTQVYLSQSAKESQRLQYLVDKVLQSSLLEEGALQLTLEKADLKMCLAEASEAMQLMAAENGVSLQIKQPNKSVWVKIDKELTCRAVANVLENAIKYGPDNSQINILMEEKEQHVLLQIQDQGPGVSPKYLGQIFDRFFRMPTGNVHNVKGHGLGLHFVKNVLNKQGIEVSASNLNPGFSINIKFPKHA